MNVAALERKLRERPSAFGFFQAVRLLERLRPRRTAVGGFDDPGDEAVRFGTPATLAFPVSEVRSVELPEDESAPAGMVVDFMGLTGPSGVLPHPYSLLLWERERARDGALHAFLDLFHHRVLSLFYRAWRKHRFVLAAEAGTPDPLAAHLLDVAGVGLDPLRRTLAVPEEAVAFYAGLLSLQPAAAVAVEQLLGDFFGVPVEVQQFTGSWSPLLARDITHVTDEEDGVAGLLGGGVVVGDEVWDPQGAIRIRIGPLTRRQYDAFLPDGDAHALLRSLVRLVTRDQVEVEVQLVLERSAVPELVLGSERADGRRLGWSTWLRARPLDHNADETVLAV